MKVDIGNLVQWETITMKLCLGRVCSWNDWIPARLHHAKFSEISIDLQGYYPWIDLVIWGGSA